MKYYLRLWGLGLVLCQLWAGPIMVAPEHIGPLFYGLGTLGFTLFWGSFLVKEM